MILLIDVGNTRTKWALAPIYNINHDFKKIELSHFGACMNAELALSPLQQTAKKAKKVVVANVAGEQMAQKLQQLLSPLTIHFKQSTHKACGVINSYQQPEKLGIDRFAALIAAWHLYQYATVVVNAGTAITIDALDNYGVFLGGTIMPGLQLMHATLNNKTANLMIASGGYENFPVNTQNAIETGCVNAAIGSILLMVEKLQASQAKKVQLLLTGGDASKLLAALNIEQKKAIITHQLNPQLNPYLVLQGILLLERERA